MTIEDKKRQGELLEKAMKESFRKMLEQKKKLGQSIVTSDGQGHPITLTAEEAERLVYGDQQ